VKSIEGRVSSQQVVCLVSVLSADLSELCCSVMVFGVSDIPRFLALCAKYCQGVKQWCCD
jgi:hypothetical protein